MKTTLETSGEDVKTTLETSGELRKPETLVMVLELGSALWEINQFEDIPTDSEYVWVSTLVLSEVLKLDPIKILKIYLNILETVPNWVEGVFLRFASSTPVSSVELETLIQRRLCQIITIIVDFFGNSVDEVVNQG